MKKEKQRWPAWCLGPNGESVLVKVADELPKGFIHPRLKPSAPAVDPEPVSAARRGRPPKSLDL